MIYSKHNTLYLSIHHPHTNTYTHTYTHTLPILSRRDAGGGIEEVGYTIFQLLQQHESGWNVSVRHLTITQLTHGDPHTVHVTVLTVAVQVLGVMVR